MRRFADACERVAATPRRTEKIAILASTLRAYSTEDAKVAVVFLGGRPFPACDDRTLDVGGSLLQRALLELSGASDEELGAAYRRQGDLGAAAFDVCAALPEPAVPPSPTEARAAFDALAAARGQASKLGALRELLRRAGPLELKYLVKIITSELRIGSKESLVQEAVAAAFDAPLVAVQRADMLLGDAGETWRLASEGKLDTARLRLLHAVAPMLASPAESAADAFERLPGALVEDKFDGIRAQAHVLDGAARLFSRTGDDVTSAFPELPPELARFGGELVLDGEVLAWDLAEARALPFSALQKRLGRKKPTAEVQRAVPVAFLAFDLLHDGDLWIDRPLAERRARLEALFAARAPAPPKRATGQLSLFTPAAAPPEGAVLLAKTARAESETHIDELFDAARARGNEGLMLKDLASPYTPGRRGKAWLKIKRELATLDVVVTAVEYGHGKRAGVISDYTFAVRDGERLVNIGKAYTGLTDAEIARLTTFFLENTIEDKGRVRLVHPVLVIEVAFNNMMRTKRHASGLALRFPRIVRLREDKRVEDIDTLETAEGIYERQG